MRANWEYMVRVQQRRAIGAHFAEAAVIRTEPARNHVFLQHSSDSAPQRMTRQILDSAAGPLQRRQSLLITLAVPHQVQRNQQIVGHVPQRMGACGVQRVPVMDDAF